MDTIQCWVGIDVSKKKLDIALLRDDRIKPKSLSNNLTGFKQFKEWLIFQKVDLDHVWVCLEATGPYSDTLATWLDDNDFKVSVVNQARIKGYAQSELVRNKTDKTDAPTIARFCQAVKLEGSVLINPANPYLNWPLAIAALTASAADSIGGTCRIPMY